MTDPLLAIGLGFCTLAVHICPSGRLDLAISGPTNVRAAIRHPEVTEGNRNICQRTCRCEQRATGVRRLFFYSRMTRVLIEPK
jgi:hypothetical protein